MARSSSRDGADPDSDGSHDGDARAVAAPPTPPIEASPSRVYVGHVPSSLCLHEPGIRQLFEPFGAITAVTVHHDALNMGADGFMFLEFASESSARAAVAAVAQSAAAQDDKFEGMHARLAVARGASALRADPSVVDLLLGRRQASEANPFSQHSVFQQTQEDEDDFILQSLSQRTTRRSSQGGGGSSQREKRAPRKKRKMDD